MSETPPRTPPRRYRLPPEMVSQSPTSYSPVRQVNIDFDSEQMAREATILEEQQTRLRREIEKLKKDVSDAAKQLRAELKSEQDARIAKSADLPQRSLAARASRQRYDGLYNELNEKQSMLLDVNRRAAVFGGRRRRRKTRKTRKTHKRSR